MGVYYVFNMVREFPVKTTVMDGNYDSLKAAFSRSVLGVTYKKNKRKKKSFYATRVHNEEFTKKAFEYLYLTLRNKVEDNLNKYKLRATYTLIWDDNGTIMGFKDLTFNIYQTTGTLIIDNIHLTKNEDIVKIDVFYSDYDSGSKMTLDILNKIEKEIGLDKISISKHNINDDDYQEMTRLFNVELIPAVQINEIKIKEPDEKKIRDAILKTLDQKIKSPEPQYIPETDFKKTILKLSQKLSK